MTSSRRRRPPRVLYLAFYFPPSRASGVYRARATANHLASRGWDVTTVTAPIKFLREVIGSTDDALVDTIDERIHIERPPMRQFIWDKDLRSFTSFRRSMPIVANRLHRFGQDRVFPERYSSWGTAAVRRALRLHASQRFDVVLATGNPFTSFAAAWLFNRLTGVPYIVDYRDSWSLNLFTEQPGHAPDSLVWPWEKRILKHASAVVFVNDALRGWHAERYPSVADRMMVVPNGWDPDLMPNLAAHAVHDDAERRPLQYAYLGTLSSAQPVEELVAAFGQAREHPDLADAELNLHGYLGFFKEGHGQMIDRLGLDTATHHTKTGIHFRGPVPKTEVADVYDASDVLVFLAGGARYVTSGKIFEYMATGRPIVSVHNPGIAAADVLSGYPLWFNANSLRPEDVAQSIIAAGKAARDLTPEMRAAAQRHAAAYTREVMLQPLEERLRSLVKHPTPPIEPSMQLPLDSGLSIDKVAATELPKTEDSTEKAAAATDQAVVTADESTAPAEKPSARTHGRVRKAKKHGRVVVVSFAYQPIERIYEYLNFLVEREIPVDFVSFDGERWDDVLDKRIRVHSVRAAEDSFIVRKIERLFVYVIPGRSLYALKVATEAAGLDRITGRTVGRVRWVHRMAAGAFHNKIYAPWYRLVRPYVLARLARRQLDEIDLAGVDRIVAADVYSVTAAHYLSGKAPEAVATMALDRHPYL